ncbi:MAG: altronate dehydratase [Ileibacterium sp.]|nr:altronate dehydratase [Ileibacterium sp.]
MKNRWIKIHPKDNTAVALEDLSKGESITVENADVVLQEDIPSGHKFSLIDLKENENVIKYGMPIGSMKADALAGSWIHVHNVKTNLSDLNEYSYTPELAEEMKAESASFMGYLRNNGKAGVRNEIWIIPTVGCVNNIGQALEKAGRQFVGNAVEDVIAFTHPYGCSQMDNDQENTRNVLADLIAHPNAGGVLVVGLGCENSNIDVLKNYIAKHSIDENRIRYMNCQDVEDEIGEGLRLIEELAETMKNDFREPLPSSKLIVGLKCGGSDGLSGITANPVVGGFSDLLIAQGGTTILTEVPEMFGAETLLMNRCENEELFSQTVDLINGFKEYFQKNGQTIYENPSPGNKKGGITTLEDKSLGCVQKAGSSNVKGVLAYGQPVENKGLNLLYAPGNDLVASTALAASGAQIVLFTTGRGTPFACPVPTMKISTNAHLASRKSNWIDFDCSPVIHGMTVMERAQDLLDKVLATASGEKVQSEKAGYHDMAIFKQGVTL